MQNSLETKTQPIPLGKTFIIIGIIFIALNLRPSITAVGPLIGTIQSELSITSSMAGLLTTLPLLAFACLSLFAPIISHRWGNERVIFAGVLVLFMGIVLRSLGLVAGLFIGTALIGAGIAVSNVILPGLIKHYFPHQVGLLTSLYTTVMALSAGIASGLSAPLAFQLDLGWQYALLIWGACAFLALVIWLPFTRLKPDIKPGAVQTQSSFGPMWRSALAWQVTFYMGSQSLLFYSLNTWLPEILISKGMEVTAAGWLLAYMQFIGLPATFLAPVLANRFTDQKWLAASTGLFIMVGLVGLLLDPSLTLVIVWVSLVAIGSGAAVSLALTLMGLRSQTAQQAAQLSGMAQSIGYLLAAVGPVLLGALFDLTHSWSLPIILLIINGLFLSVTGLGAGRDRYVL